MADKSFGIKELNLIGSGTPKIESPNNINLNANNVAISTNATVGGNLDMGGHIALGDSKILKLGAAPDMSIFHDGTSGSINLANGSLTTRVHDAVGKGFYIEDPNSGSAETIAKFEKDATSGSGRCELMHGGLKKFETTSSGVTITGNLTVTGTYPGSGGSSTFVGLSDTPSNFTSQANKFVKVNSGASALEFTDLEPTTVLVAESSDDSNGYNIPFLTTTGAGGAQKGLQVDNGGLGFNPGTNFLFVQNVQLGGGGNAGALNIYNSSSRLFGEINGIPFGEGNSNNSTNIVIGNTTPSNSAGNYNVALGTQALHSSTGGVQSNVAIGYQALMTNDGAYSVAIGDNALSGTGSANIGLGRQAGHQIAGAQYNIFLGYQPAYSVTNIGHSVAMGYQALYSIAAGKMAGLSGTGNTYGHIAIGYNSQKYFQGIDQNGAPNIAMGIFSLENNVQNGANTAIGNFALRNLGKGMTATNYTGGYGNTAIGHNAIAGGYSGDFSSTDTFRGDYNTAIGWGSLYLLRSHTSDKNTAVGVQAGDIITTGSNNTCIGASADASSATVSNEITLGDNNVSTLRCNVQTISSLSDARDKTDIVDIPTGLDFLNDLRPVKFKWQTRDGNGKDGSISAGFLAQDLQKIQKDSSAEFLNLVMDNNPDRLEAREGQLIPVLVKAIQELSVKNDALEARIKTLEG